VIPKKQESLMISQGANPDCRRELRYLRDGRIYAFAMSAGSGSKWLEHFWHCGGCSKRMTIICVNQSEVKTGVSGKLREPQHPVTGLPGSISNVKLSLINAIQERGGFYESGHCSWRGISRL
jgi:hypothetical protein